MRFGTEPDDRDDAEQLYEGLFADETADSGFVAEAEEKLVGAQLVQDLANDMSGVVPKMSGRRYSET